MTDQYSPASVVRRMVPARPTTQQTLGEGEEPEVRSATTLLACRTHDVPPSLENSMRPAWPTRQSDWVPGTKIKYGGAEPAIAAGVSLTSLSATEGAGVGACEGGACGGGPLW